jgi:import inner membrane translocase subunit TIM23
MSSFLGNLFGISTPPPQPAQNDEFSAASNILNSTEFRSAVPPTTPPAAPSDADLAAPPAPAVAAPSAADMLGSQFDVAKLHPMADLNDNLDFLALDEDKLTEMEGAGSVLPSRGWTDDLCVGTGTTYLSGLAIGGAWGLKEGLSRPLGPNPSMRLRLNSVLNACTRRGSFTGNSLGVLAIYYNLTNSALDAVREKHDPINSMAAGAFTGAVYKCTSGVRPMLVGAAIGTGAMGAWEAFKTFV